MENTSYILLSRQDVIRRQMDVLANNIANMNSTAFKAERMLFVDHLVRSKGGEKPFGVKQAYVRDVASYRIQDEGAFRETRNPLDVAIHGPGFLVVETELGNLYTRNGHMRLDENGQLVTEAGDPVLAEGDEPIFLAPEDSNVVISRDGTISTDAGPLARLRLVEFERPQDLAELSAGLYQSAADPIDTDQRDVVQGMLEDSNVQPIFEITRMITAQRAYESVNSFINREDERVKSLGRALLGSV